MVELVGRYARRSDLLKTFESVRRRAEGGRGDEVFEAAYRPYLLRHRVDDKTLDQLIQDYVDGMATTELTGKYRLSKASVLKILEDSGTPMRRQGLSAEQLAKATALYQSGLSLAVVGDRLGVWPSSVGNSLRRAGVPLRPGRRGR